MFKLLILFSLIVVVFGGCPKGSVERGTKCYHFFIDPLPFVKAEQACNGLDGHLASVDDGYTNAFLARKF